MAKNAVRIVMSIVERQKGKKLIRFYKEHGVTCHFRTMGHGTASSELLDILGFGSSERDLLLSFGAEREVQQLFSSLREEYDAVPARGIAFSAPLSALNALAAAVLMKEDENPKENREMISQECPTESTKGDSSVIPEGSAEMNSAENSKVILKESPKEKEMENEMGKEMKKENPQQKEHSLILIVVNQGYTEEVMNTARTAGARGGTIIRSRWAGSEESELFCGMTLQAEKEIIAILAGSEHRKQIMEAVNRLHGMNTPAGAMICSVGVEEVQRFG